VAAVAEKTGGKPIEIWFGDEARIGQKNKITRRWAKRGTRPSAPRDQRTASAYIFGAICPQHGKGAGLVLPSCNTEAMALHLEEIAAAVAPGAHAILVLDQAGWHVSKTLPVPPNITLVSLPPKSPERIHPLCTPGKGRPFLKSRYAAFAWGWCWSFQCQGNNSPMRFAG
jgi:hypothetical protein